MNVNYCIAGLIIKIMNKVVFIILLSSSFVVHSEQRLTIVDGLPNDFDCKVEINDSVARFYFINEVSKYKNGITWNKDVRSATEYSWLVYFDKSYVINEKAYEGVDVGLRYFSRDEAERNGALEKLIDESELYAFGYINEYYFPLEIFGHGDLSVELKGDDLVISVAKSNDSCIVYDNFPDNAFFWVIEAGGEVRKCSAKIN